jgi:hypothetical protein
MNCMKFGIKSFEQISKGGKVIIYLSHYFVVVTVCKIM